MSSECNSRTPPTKKYGEYARHKKAQWLPDQRCTQREPGICCISMDTSLFLGSIVPFYSERVTLYPRKKEDRRH
jgi:hypothetical protein